MSAGAVKLIYCAEYNKLVSLNDEGTAMAPLPSLQVHGWYRNNTGCQEPLIQCFYARLSHSRAQKNLDKLVEFFLQNICKGLKSRINCIQETYIFYSLEL